MEEIRLNKYLSDSGICSRREADRLIESGKVTVDGETAVMGMKVTGDQQIFVNGKLVTGGDEDILLAVNKPVGIVCTTASEEKNNIVDFIGYPKRIYPIGRLDKDSEGLILMTNQGELVNKILRGGNNHEKEYLVKVNKPVTSEFMRGMSEGVPILDTVTKPCVVERTGYNGFRIILTQGLNRQIRRMCEYFGYRVTYLKRIRVMNIKLGNLKVGEYRRIEGAEYQEVMKLLEHSTGKTWAELHSEEQLNIQNVAADEATETKTSVAVAKKNAIKSFDSNTKISSSKRSSFDAKNTTAKDTNKMNKKVNIVIRRENSGLKKDNGKVNSSGE